MIRKQQKQVATSAPFLEEQLRKKQLNNKQPEQLVNKKQPQVANFTGITEYVIKQKYKLLNYCKGGAFGDVFFACHVHKGYEVAVKFSDSKNEEATRQYENEVEVIKIIRKVAGPRGNYILFHT